MHRVLCHIAVQKFHPRNRYRRYLKEKREELRKSLANGAAAAGAPAAARMGPGPAALVAAADEEMGTAESDHNFPLSSHLHAHSVLNVSLIVACFCTIVRTLCEWVEFGLNHLASQTSLNSR